MLELLYCYLFADFRIPKRFVQLRSLSLSGELLKRMSDTLFISALYLLS